jgi:serine/threonine-protein kinase HipA
VTSFARLAEADVFRDRERAGRLMRTEAGAVFGYDEAFVARHGEERATIAVTLPASARRFECRGVNLHPFFAGLLPEGQRFVALSRRVKTSPDDLFSLLVAAGSDCIGDVSVTRPDRAPAEIAPRADLRALDQVSFEELFEASLHFPGLEAGGESSIAGLQPKLPASMISFPVRGRRRGAYLLKLAPPELPRLVENEAFVMRVAASCGLTVAKTHLVHDREGRSGLLVERFDRIAGGRGKPLGRVYQEDACQLLGRYPADKYHVSLREVAEAVTAVSSAPVVDAARLLRLQAFSYLVCNGDLHAKNVSVRRSADGRIELTPAYDLVTTLPYGDQTMALTMEGRDANLKRRDFLAFGARLGVREAAIGAMLDELGACLARWIDRFDEIGLDPRKTAHLARAVRQRATDVAP